MNVRKPKDPRALPESISLLWLIESFVFLLMFSGYHRCLVAGSPRV